MPYVHCREYYLGLNEETKNVVSIVLPIFFAYNYLGVIPFFQDYFTVRCKPSNDSYYSLIG